MIEWITKYFEAFINNPLYFTIFGSTVVGIILYLCREVPKKFFRTILGMLTINVEVMQNPDETAYECIELEIQKSKLYYICGNFQLVYTYLSRKLHLACAQSTMFFGKINNTWCIITKYTDESAKMFHYYGYSLRFLTRDKKRVQQFTEQLLSNYNGSPTEEFIKIHKYIDGGWDSFDKRKIDFACIQPDIYEDIISKVYKLQSNDKLGVLLHGQPGCGKTHLIQMIASVLDRNIYYMNLSEFANDNDFIKAILQVHHPAIILFEDLDANNGFNRKKIKMKDLFKKNNETEAVQTGVTLSCLLNVFDGLLTQQGQLIIATTNHIEDLDKALIRSGRFDINEELTPLESKDIFIFLSNYYCQQIPKCGKINTNITVSDLVKICKEYSSIDLVIKELKSKEE